MKEILRDLFDHKTLSRQEARRVLTSIARGEYNQSHMAAFLTVYLMRSITVEELAGFRDAMLELCIPVDFHDLNTIDLCGTGGDGKDTFNISTLASFVVAGAGGMVAKHGNYGVSSACGSSNIMETAGYKFSNDPSKLRREIEEAGICFFHAPLFNPAMKNVGPVRKELGMKTFFNILGPMVNPSQPVNQLVGVFSLELARLYNYLYQETGKNFVILHSLDGYDEISLTGEVRMISNREDRILSPEQMGFRRIKPEQIRGGNTVAESVKIFMELLEGKGDEIRTSVVLVNAAMAIQCLNQDKSYDECVDMARESIISGKAKNVLTRLISLQA
jgi:anthranilate phosphoribosyltransferase